MNSTNEHSELEEYGDEGITSLNAPVPKWLKFNYIFWPLWGVVWFYMFWNGSAGWFDRGYWNELQKAANTTFPQVNVDELRAVNTPPQTRPADKAPK